MTSGRFTNLADHLRSWGLDVVEVDGWETRGKPFPDLDNVKVVVCHHTGTRRRKDYPKTDLPTLNVLINGRSDLPGPLCAVGLGYSGKVYVIAAGRANHAGKGHWLGLYVGNDRSLGIEAESPGDGTWTAEQRRVYPILAAALADLENSDALHVCAHWESAEPHGRKNDPVGISMPQFRQAVKALLAVGPKHSATQLKKPLPPHPAWWTHTTQPGQVSQEVASALKVLNNPDYPPQVTLDGRVAALFGFIQHHIGETVTGALTLNTANAIEHWNS